MVGAPVPCCTVAQADQAQHERQRPAWPIEREHGRRPPADPAIASARISWARANPASAVRKASPVAPSSDAAGSNGPSGWENATPPQGNPPNGNRARSASPVIQADAAQTGHSGSRREAAAISAPAGAVSSASATTSAYQGKSPT